MVIFYLVKNAYMTLIKKMVKGSAKFPKKKLDRTGIGKYDQDDEPLGPIAVDSRRSQAPPSTVGSEYDSGS